MLMLFCTRVPVKLDTVFGLRVSRSPWTTAGAMGGELLLRGAQRCLGALSHPWWNFRIWGSRPLTLENSCTHARSVAQLCPTPATPWTVAQQAPLSMGFSMKEYWSGLPFPPLGDLPDPGIEPRSLALQADSLLSEPPGKPPFRYDLNQIPYDYIVEMTNIFKGLDLIDSDWRTIDQSS